MPRQSEGRNRSGSGRADARNLALRIIGDACAGMPLQEALSRRLNEAATAGAAARERQLASELAWGVLRQRLRLDFILSQFLARPAKLPGRLLAILRIAVYSMIFLDGIPHYAAADCAVRQAKSFHGQRLGSLCNAVLRKVAERTEEMRRPQFYLASARLAFADDDLALGRFYSLPTALVRHWRSHYPESYLALMRRSAARPWAALRLNARHELAAKAKAFLEGLEGVENPAPFAYAFAPGQSPQGLLGQPLEHWQKEGLLSWQAAGSQVLMQKLDLPGGAFWDACAGVGGKSLWLMEKGREPGLASDTSFRRLAEMRRQCARLGLDPPAFALGSAATGFARAWHGHILIDAPCSGLGVLARRPDILLHNQNLPAFFQEREQMQRSILRQACGQLVAGKSLIYITCTLNPAENERMVDFALGENSKLKLLVMWQTPPEHPWLEGMFGAHLYKGL